MISSLVELDASFNSLSYLPTNIGFELRNLQKLMIQLNKIRSLPSSICEMKSLRYLDAHFNELRGLPIAIGKLTSLQVLNLSSNFSDLRELPETFGDLINLRDLDLSNNQIHALPDSFGRLHNLTKLNLDQNPLEVPPMDIVAQGVQAVKSFMSQRWIDILAEEERKTTQELQEHGENGWLSRSTSWLKNVSDNVTEMIMSPRTPKEAYLNQQLWAYGWGFALMLIVRRRSEHTHTYYQLTIGYSQPISFLWFLHAACCCTASYGGWKLTSFPFFIYKE